MPNGPGTPRRTIRVPDATWNAAKAKAQERGEDLAQVLRDALDRYIEKK